MSSNTNDVLTLMAEPLTAEGFAPFGDVIESTGESIPINQGKGWRFLDLAKVDVETDGGHAAISRVAAAPEALPVPLRLMERHPLGSQAFIPVDGQRYLVVVAPAGEPPVAADLRAFIATGKQGINYHRGVWHHPMIGLGQHCEFLEVHRKGPGRNLNEVDLDRSVQVAV